MKISIFSDFSTQFISKDLQENLGLFFNDIKIKDFNYSPIESHLYSGNDFGDNQYFLILESTFYIYEKYLLSSNKEEFSEIEFQRISSILLEFLNQYESKIIVSNYFEYNDKLYGNQSGKVKSSFIYQLRKLNFLVSELIQQHENILLFDLNSLILVNGYNLSVDKKLYTQFSVLFSFDLSKLISKNLHDIICSNTSRAIKCIVLDLDNTIWGGIIGDDGIDKIQIGNVGIGKSFTLLQHWLKLSKDLGIVLCVCSKNNEEIAKSPFLEHPDMILRLEDITLFLANWQDKATNIKLIKETLNIGYDSIVFLDDNIFERELVKKAIPELIVPELPKDPVDYLDYLTNENILEPNFSKKRNNIDRTSLYKTEFERLSFKKKFDKQEDYLDSLNMFSKIEELNSFDIARISELSKRTNQFNLTGVRSDESDLEKILSSQNYLCYSFSLRDSFGKYGIVSYLILEIQNNNLKIINWCMSCRVFKRTLEQFILNQLVFKLDKFNKIEGELVPTSKNKVLKLFLTDLGLLTDNKISIEINRFKKLKTSINHG